MSSESIPRESSDPDRIGFVPDNPYLANFRKPYIPCRRATAGTDRVASSSSAHLLRNGFRGIVALSRSQSWSDASAPPFRWR